MISSTRKMPSQGHIRDLGILRWCRHKSKVDSSPGGKLWTDLIANWVFGRIPSLVQKGAGSQASRKRGAGQHAEERQRSEIDVRRMAMVKSSRPLLSRFKILVILSDSSGRRPPAQCQKPKSSRIKTLLSRTRRPSSPISLRLRRIRQPSRRIRQLF